MHSDKAANLNEGNYYHLLSIDIQKSHKIIDRISYEKKSIKRFYFKNRVQFFIDIVLIKYELYELFIRIGVFSQWFKEFKEYWQCILDGRPIGISDFFMLYHEFRKRQQLTHTLDWGSPEQHVGNWQHKDMIFYTFYYAYKLAISPVVYNLLWEKIPRNSRILEYGASLGPFYYCYRRYFNHKSCTWCLADIPNFPFHFAKYKYKQDKEVNFITINPENFEDPLKNTDTYDVIICSEVLEHVEDPLFMVKYLLDKLSLNGLFVFDFISSSGTGLDTPNGLIFRKAALQYISERVEVLNGEISIEKSCGLCIVRKVLS